MVGGGARVVNNKANFQINMWTFFNEACIFIFHNFDTYSYLVLQRSKSIN